MEIGAQLYTVRRMTQTLEGLAETLVNLLEAGQEQVGHLPRDLGDDIRELLLGLLHIVPLTAEEFVAGVDPLILLDSAQIGIAQGSEGFGKGRGIQVGCTRQG